MYIAVKRIAFLSSLAAILLISPAPAIASSVVNSATYGVKCDGSTDDTNSLQSFLNAIGQNGSGIIQPGVCIFSSTLTFPNNRAKVSGSGQYATVLTYNGNSTTIDLLSLSGSSPSPVPGYVTISDLSVTSNTKMTAGTAIHIKYAGFINLQNITADGQGGNGNLYEGFWFDSTDMIRLEGFEARAQDDAIRVSAGGVGSGAQFDLFIAHGKIGGSKTGVHIGGGFDNFHMDDTEITSNGTNVQIDTALSPHKNQEIFFGPGVVTDQAQSGNNYYISDTLADRTNFCTIVIAGAVTNSAHASGIRVKDWPNCFVIIQSPYIIGNSGSGVQIDDSSSIINISPSTIITGNGQYGVLESFASSSVINAGAAIANGAGQYSSNVGGSVYFPTQVSTGSNVQISTAAAASSSGTSYSSATQLTTQFSYVTSVSPGQGVRLPAFINTEMFVQNSSGSNNLLVYPPAGAKYGAGTVNGGASINSAASIRVLCTSSTQCWIN